MILPEHLFFTGVPGSHWSAIAQDLETISGFNTSDRTENRAYKHEVYSGHLGSYFGTDMEFTANIETMSDTYITQHINSPWKTSAGTKIVKSHEWAYKLRYIKKTFLNDWIMLVYRPDIQSQAWWHEAGGFSKISYPSYASYKDPINMMCEIMKQNQSILQFAYDNDATWSHYTEQWINETFGAGCSRISKPRPDILVTVIK